MAKMHLCSRCGISLDEIRPGVFSCPKGHGEWTAQGDDKIIREPLSAIYAGGAVEYKGAKNGRNKKKQSQKERWNSLYAEN